MKKINKTAVETKRQPSGPRSLGSGGLLPPQLSLPSPRPEGELRPASLSCGRGHPRGNLLHSTGNLLGRETSARPRPQSLLARHVPRCPEPPDPGVGRAPPLQDACVTCGG